MKKVREIFDFAINTALGAVGAICIIELYIKRDPMWGVAAGVLWIAVAIRRSFADGETE